MIESIFGVDSNGIVIIETEKGIKFRYPLTGNDLIDDEKRMTAEDYIETLCLIFGGYI